MDSPIILNSVNSDSGKSHDFTTRFIPNLTLEKNTEYYIALDSCTMHYSWYNISSQYNNNTIAYTVNGNPQTTYTIPDGVYTYEELATLLNVQMNISSNTVDEQYISLIFDTTNYRVRITLNNVTLHFNQGKFHSLLGFDNGDVSGSASGTHIPNITNSIDEIQIHCSLISDSIVSGRSSDILHSFGTATLERSFPFKIEPRRALFNKINSHDINKIRIYITDTLGRPIDLNEIPISLTLILRKNIL